MSHYNLPDIFRGAGHATDIMNGVLGRIGLDARIDEIAYLFEDSHAFESFTEEAVQEEGCTLFNSARDHVEVSPLTACYNVQYRFFTIPEQYLDGNPVRIEAMLPGSGLSPLHLAAAYHLDRVGREWNCMAIHASFKCVDEESYGKAVLSLRGAGWEVAQKCDSTYGKFSYWTPLDREDWLGDGPFIYLKPRVNLRDGSFL